MAEQPGVDIEAFVPMSPEQTSQQEETRTHQAAIAEIGEISTRLVGLNREAVHGRPETEAGHDLYKAIVDLSTVPELPIIGSSSDVIPITVVSGNTVTIAGRRVALRQHELYLFNAMILLRNEPRGARELRSFGFNPGSQSEIATSNLFSQTVNALMAKVNKAAAAELIKRLGQRRAAKYALSSQVILQEARSEFTGQADLAQPKRFAFLELDPAKGGTAVPEKLTDFGSNAQRDEAVFRLIKKYGKHPAAERALRQTMNRSARTKSLEDFDGLYMQSIAQYDLLDAEQEKELFSHLEYGLGILKSVEGAKAATTPQQETALINAAMAYEIIYCTNLRLVVALAKNYIRRDGAPFRDIIQEGNIGLGIAIRRFDITKDLKLSTYASWWIHKAIKRYNAGSSRIIHLPEDVHYEWTTMQSTLRELEVGGHDVSDEELAEAMGWGTAKVELLQRAGALHITSLNQAPPNNNVEDYGSHLEIGDIVAETGPQETDDQLERIDTREVVSQTLARAELDSRVKTILSLFFAVNIDELQGTMVRTKQGEIPYENLLATVPSDKGLTSSAIGRLLGLSGARVRYLKDQALGYLREYLER